MRAKSKQSPKTPGHSFCIAHVLFGGLLVSVALQLCMRRCWQLGAKTLGWMRRYGTYKAVQQMPGGQQLVAFTRILHRTTPDILMQEVRAAEDRRGPCRRLQSWVTNLRAGDWFVLHNGSAGRFPGEMTHGRPAHRCQQQLLRTLWLQISPPRL